MPQNEGLNVEVNVLLSKLARQLAAAEARTVKTANRMERSFVQSNRKSAQSFQRVDRAIERTGSNVTRLGSVLAGAFSVREIQRYGDEWTVAENKIAAASEVAGRSARSLSAITDIADETRSGIAETADLYAKLLRSTKDVAESEEEVARATELVNKAFKAGGAAASEQAAGILQLAQGLSSGILQGDELRSIRENAPLVAQAIADEFGVTIGKLKELGAEGELTSDRVFQAILRAQPQIEAAFGKTNATVAEGFTRLRNALTEYLGAADDSIRATERIGAALEFLASNLDIAATAAALVAVRFGGAALSRLFATVAVQARAASGALVGLSGGARVAAASVGVLRGALAILGGPIGAVLSGLALLPILTTSVAERIENLSEAGTAAIDALDQYAAASKRAGIEQGELAGKVSAATQEILNQSRANLQSSLRDLRSEYADLKAELEDGIVFNSDTTSLGQQLSSAGASNPFLAALGEQLKEIGDGSGDIAAVSNELERLAGVGEEASSRVEQFDLALRSAGEVDLQGASSELIEIAEVLGGFTQELDAIKAADGFESQQAAVIVLRDALFDAAQAGRALRTENAESVRDQLAGAARAQDEIEAVTTALEGNVEEALGLAKELDGASRTANEVSSASDAIISPLSKSADEAARLSGNLRSSLESLRAVAAGITTAQRRTRNQTAIRQQTVGEPEARASGLARENFNEESGAAAFESIRSGNFGQLSSIRKQGDRISEAAGDLARAQESLSEAESSYKESVSGGKEQDPFFQSVEREIASLEQQITLIGSSSGAIAEATTRTELLNEAKERGLNLDTRSATTGKTLREEIDGQAAAIGRLTEAQESLTNQTQFWNTQLDDVRGGIVDAIVEGENLNGTLKDVAKSIAKAALEAALFNDGPLKDLFGTGGGLAGNGSGSSGGVIGGFLGGLLGFEGGGYTGSGSRTGGVDGRGGFPAILHPNETVIDHTKAGATGGGSMNINVNVEGANGDQHVMNLVEQGVAQGMSQVRSEVPSIMGSHTKRRG